jgi:peptidyl-prolyl isomerase G (cyclophilin G)
MSQVPVDAKSRPDVPIVISNCGELELRKQPVAPGMLFFSHELESILNELELQKQPTAPPTRRDENDDARTDHGHVRRSAQRIKRRNLAPSSLLRL